MKDVQPLRCDPRCCELHIATLQDVQPLRGDPIM